MWLRTIFWGVLFCTFPVLEHSITVQTVEYFNIYFTVHKVVTHNYIIMKREVLCRCPRRGTGDLPSTSTLCWRTYSCSCRNLTQGHLLFMHYKLDWNTMKKVWYLCYFHTLYLMPWIKQYVSCLIIPYNSDITRTFTWFFYFYSEPLESLKCLFFFFTKA